MENIIEGGPPLHLSRGYRLSEIKEKAPHALIFWNSHPGAKAAGSFYACSTAHTEEFQQFIRSLPPHERCFNECIDGTRPHKFFLDIDAEGVPKQLWDELEAGIHEVLMGVLTEVVSNLPTGIHPRIGVIHSHRDGPPQHSKFSCHYVVQSFHVADYTVARSIAARVTASLAERYPDYPQMIDMGMYATNHNLRILHCVKPNEPNRPCVESTRYPFICFEDSLITPVFNEPVVNARNLGIAEAIHAAPPIAVNAVDANPIVEKMIAAASAHLTGYTPRGVIDGGDTLSVLFDRVKGTITPPCVICLRRHDNDNAPILTLHRDRVMFRCRRDPTNNSVLVGRIDQAPPRPPLHELINRYGETPILPIFPKEWPVTRYHTAHVQEYTGFTTEYDTLLVYSGMGTGKTYMLKKFLDTHPALRTVVALSFRKTFTDEKSEQLNLRDYRSYAERGPIGPGEGHPRIIIQVESIPRLEIPPPDLLILDEFESIISQFDLASAAIWYKLEWLLQHSKNVIVMDAALGPRSVGLIKDLRVDMWQEWCKEFDVEPRRVSVHVNSYKSMAATTVYLYPLDKTKFVSAIVDYVRTGAAPGEPRPKVVICSGSKTLLKTAEKILTARLVPPPRVFCVHAETAEEWRRMLAEHYAAHSAQDPNWTLGMSQTALVNGYDVFGYSPSLTAGVSIEDVDAERLWCYFTNKSVDYRTAMQMIGRVRNITEIHLLVCAVPTRHLPTRPQDILSWYIRKDADGRRLNRDPTLDAVGAPVMLPNGEYQYRYAQCPRFQARLRELCEIHKCENAFFFLLAERLREAGATFERPDFLLDAHGGPRNPNEIPGVTREEYKNAEKISIEQSARKIVDSRQLSREEYEDLLGKSCSYSDSLAMRRYQICFLARINPARLSVRQVTIYGSSSVERQLRNLHAVGGFPTLIECLRNDNLARRRFASVPGFMIDYDEEGNEEARREVALKLIELMGFSLEGNTFDFASEIPADDFQASMIGAVRTYLIDNCNMVNYLFAWRRERQIQADIPADFPLILRRINGLLDTMFGLQVAVNRYNRGKRYTLSLAHYITYSPHGYHGI